MAAVFVDLALLPIATPTALLPPLVELAFAALPTATLKNWASVF